MLQAKNFELCTPPTNVERIKAMLDQHCLLDPAIVRGEKDDFVNMVAIIVKESFRPYFHALGLPWEEDV